MNIKSTYSYQMKDNKKAIIIFYLIIICLYVMLDVVNNIYGANSETSGIEIATVVFVFIAGLSSFKETFGMMIQNGVSRKTMFIGNLLTIISVCLLMAVFEKILKIILNLIARNGLNYSSLYEQIYSSDSVEISSLSFIYYLLLYISFMSLGFFITVLFYRLGKSGKIAVGAGVPVALFVILPIVDSVITKGRIFKTISEFIDFSYGLSASKPVHAIITSIILFIILNIFSWILMRKAVVKD